MISIQKLFYRKPTSLGEGLARVKKSLGIKANEKDYSTIPGIRRYSAKKGSVTMKTDSFTEEHKCIYKGVKSWTDVSRLSIIKKDECGNIKTQYDIHYCASHDSVGREATPFRYRNTTRTDKLEHKTITHPTMYLY